nr:uncharacterized protein LOC106685187 [Halyomorpha halys]
MALQRSLIALRFSPAQKNYESVAKGLAIWLLLLISYGSAGPRIKRLGLFSFSQPPAAPEAPETPPLPVYKVHRYTGVQLQPVELPHKDEPTDIETPGLVSLPDYPVSEPEEPEEPVEEEEPHSSGLGSVFSLIPGGLPGLLSLSSGSSSGGVEPSYEEDRIGLDRSGLLGLKKDILTSVFQNKLELLTALKRDAVQLLIRKAQAKKAWIKNLLFGSPKPGYYYNVPYYYPKKTSFLSYLPFVGHWFGGGKQLPDVQLPNVPNLVALKDPPHLPVIDLHGKYQFPYQSETYVKVAFPGKMKPVLKPDVVYQAPSTSYGVPEIPVPAPQQPLLHGSYEPCANSAAPDVVLPVVYPCAPQLPANIGSYSPYPVSYPNPQESHSYASGEYYAAQSEIQPVKERPPYKHLEDTKEELGAENSHQDGQYKETNVEESVGDNTEKSTETIVPQ